MSSAILVSDTASVRSVALAWTRASWAARAANLLGAETKGSPVISAMWAAPRVAELGVGVEARPHRGATQRQLVEVGETGLDPLEIGVELGHVPRELLAQGERHGVHEMGAPDLHDLVRRPRP